MWQMPYSSVVPSVVFMTSTLPTCSIDNAFSRNFSTVSVNTAPTAVVANNEEKISALIFILSVIIYFYPYPFIPIL